MEGSECKIHLRWGGCRRGRDASRGNLVQTLQTRAPLLSTRRAEVGRGAAGAGGGVVWSPSNRGTPRETPLRSYAMTHGGGARGLSPPRGAPLGHSRRFREVRGGTSVLACAARVLWQRVRGGGLLPWRQKSPREDL